MKKESPFEFYQHHEPVVNQTEWTLTVKHSANIIAWISKYNDRPKYKNKYCLHHKSDVCTQAKADPNKYFNTPENCIKYAGYKWISYIKNEAKGLGLI